MKRPRISLRGLLVVVTAIVLFLGYSQYRRREILKVCAELKKERYVFPVQDEWFDRYVWQRKPTVAKVQYNQEYKVEVLLKVERINGQDRFVSEINPDEIERLKELGVVEYVQD